MSNYILANTNNGCSLLDPSRSVNQQSLVLQVGVYSLDGACSTPPICGGFVSPLRYCDGFEAPYITGYSEVSPASFSSIPSAVKSGSWLYFYRVIDIVDFFKCAAQSLCENSFGPDEIIIDIYNEFKFCIDAINPPPDQPYVGLAATWYNKALTVSGGAAATTIYDYFSVSTYAGTGGSGSFYNSIITGQVKALLNGNVTLDLYP